MRKKGSTLSPEHKAAIAASMRRAHRRNPMFGKRHTAETRAKMSAAHRGWKDRKAYASPLAREPGDSSQLAIRGGRQKVEEYLDRLALDYAERAART